MSPSTTRGDTVVTRCAVPGKGDDRIGVGIGEIPRRNGSAYGFRDHVRVDVLAQGQLDPDDRQAAPRQAGVGIGDVPRQSRQLDGVIRRAQYGGPDRLVTR